ncbi:MAG: RNA polymerase sigma factor [Planctomycetota bacterium JB042]
MTTASLTPTALPPAAPDLAVLRRRLERAAQDSYASLLRTARRVLRDEHDAEEAVQDALGSATRELSRFRGEAQFTTWLHAIARNAALRLRRRRERREPLLDDVLARDESGAPAELAGPDADPSAAVSRDEAVRSVRDAIARLPEPQARLVRWRDLEATSPEEIARRLGIGAGAARVRVHRARRALRSLLAPRERRPARSTRARRSPRRPSARPTPRGTGRPADAA